MLPLGVFEHIWNAPSIIIGWCIYHIWNVATGCIWTHMECYPQYIGWCIWPYMECYCQYWVVYFTIYGMLLMDMLPLEAVVIYYSDSPCKFGGGGPTTPWLMICNLSWPPLPPISHVITSKSSMPGSTNTTVMVPRFKFITFSVDGRMLLVKDNRRSL